jgi:phosphomannomutase
MVTASHNPPEFCGIKFKAPFGGSATPAIVKEIESRLHQTPPRIATGAAGIKEVGPRQEYFEHVKSLVDFGVIQKAKPRVVADAMHGAGRNLLGQILGEFGIDCLTIRDNPDPLFGGVFPEPMEENLGALRTAILTANAGIGLATDGDADRLGATDEGNYVNTHQILVASCILCARELEGSGQDGVPERHDRSHLSEAGTFRGHRSIGFKNIATDAAGRYPDWR